MLQFPHKRNWQWTGVFSELLFNLIIISDCIKISNAPPHLKVKKYPCFSKCDNINNNCYFYCFNRLDGRPYWFPLFRPLKKKKERKRKRKRKEWQIDWIRKFGRGSMHRLMMKGKIAGFISCLVMRNGIFFPFMPSNHMFFFLANNGFNHMN